MAANLDPLAWDAGAYNPAQMAKVLAWYDLHCLVDMHKQDAVLGKK